MNAKTQMHLHCLLDLLYLLFCHSADIVFQRSLSDGRHLLCQCHGRLYARTVNIPDRNMRRQIFFFHLGGHGNHRHCLRMLVRGIIAHDHYRTASFLNACPRMTAQLRKPDIASGRHRFTMYRRIGIRFGNQLLRIDLQSSGNCRFLSPVFFLPKVLTSWLILM